MNQYMTEQLNEDDLVYAISVLDVQELAKERIGRNLDFYEMHDVKKCIEWGYFNWFDIVNIAIDSAIERNKNMI